MSHCNFQTVFCPLLTLQIFPLFISKKKKSLQHSTQKETDPAERERRKKEAEEAKRWEAVAREQLPEPFPRPTFNKQGSTEEDYKEYMRKRLEYETWENKIILLGRKLRKEAEGTS